MKKITIICFLLIAIIYSGKAQNQNQSKIKSKKMMKEMTIADFQKIVKFVLRKGDRKTYCNMYNNSPHYKIDGFDIYINPINQKINFFEGSISNNVSDYNEIVIYDANIITYYIKLDDYKAFYDSKTETYLLKINGEIENLKQK